MRSTICDRFSLLAIEQSRTITHGSSEELLVTRLCLVMQIRRLCLLGSGNFSRFWRPSNLEPLYQFHKVALDITPPTPPMLWGGLRLHQHIFRKMVLRRDHLSFANFWFLQQRDRLKSSHCCTIFSGTARSIKNVFCKTQRTGAFHFRKKDVFLQCERPRSRVLHSTRAGTLALMTLDVGRSRAGTLGLMT